MFNSLHGRKVNWVFTYGASKGYLLYQMFKDEGSLDVDECHSTSDGSIIYTYIHLQNRCSKFNVMKCMARMNEQHGFILSEIFGYDSVGCNDQTGGEILTEHIAFRMIYEHMKANNAAFISCTDGTNGVKRGLLMQYDGFARIKDVVATRRKRLLPFLENIEKELNQTKRRLDEEITRADMLAEERAHLQKENEELRRQNVDLEVKLIVDGYKQSNAQLLQEALASLDNY
jgi:hypothetical protein